MCIRCVCLWCGKVQTIIAEVMEADGAGHGGHGSATSFGLVRWSETMQVVIFHLRDLDSIHFYSSCDVISASTHQF